MQPAVGLDQAKSTNSLHAPDILLKMPFDRHPTSHLKSMPHLSRPRHELNLLGDSDQCIQKSRPPQS